MSGRLDSALPSVLEAEAPEIAGRSYVADYVILTKPRVAVLVLLTVAVGYVLGARGSADWLTVSATLIGTGLVTTSAAAWNQIIERQRDARMRRTARRPLACGRLATVPAAVFATVLVLAGLGLLFALVNREAALVALATFTLYVAVYTPSKPRTTLNTVIGAIPGALPPVIGWAAATGNLSIGAWILFLIIFLWQFPHFLAIAWIYRDDYSRAGHKMLPSVDPSGAVTSLQAVLYALVLVPCGLLPSIVGLAGPVYFLGALIVGLYYFVKSLQFWLHVSNETARGLLRASFLHLPLILVLLLANPLPL
jgi:protoheme IX farnesyltransferase